MENDLKKMYRMLESKVEINPNSECMYDEEKNVIIVKTYMGLDNGFITFCIPADDDEGYIFSTSPFPQVCVPENKQAEALKFFNIHHRTFKRGRFFLEEDGTVRFSNFIRISEGDTLSDMSVLQEVMLGIRCTRRYLPEIFEICEGKTIDEMISDAKEVNDASNDAMYIPASEDKMKLQAGSMYV